MTAFIFITLFVIGVLFFNASHVPAWFLGDDKPMHPHWKLYGFIGVGIWVVILILANTVL